MVFPSLVDAELPVGSPLGTQWGDAVADALRAYVANPLFRAADVSELEIEDNPYRRPVRPDDLEWLNFDTPVTSTTTSQLSALLGHRMLLNIYDARYPALPSRMSEARWRDFELFYGSENRRRGEFVRPFLEHHLFAHIHDAPQAASRLTDAQSLIAETVSRRTAAGTRLRNRLAGLTDPVRAMRMLTVQLVARTFATASLPTWSHDNGGELARLTALADHFGLIREQHRYYQFYLPTTLALMNYLIGTGDDPRDTYLAVGARTANQLDMTAQLHALEEVAGLSPDTSAPDRGQLLDLVTHGGPQAMVPFARGMSGFDRLLDAHDGDVDRQLTLIDTAGDHIRKAHRLYDAITRNGIKVDLDTFVETSEECSTTHVHDDDRLVVIESGEMEFWTCPGQRIQMAPGDCFFVPVHRLHGSVVRSGTCVYHQPIITAELDELYG